MTHETNPAEVRIADVVKTAASQESEAHKRSMRAKLAWQRRRAKEPRFEPTVHPYIRMVGNGGAIRKALQKLIPNQFVFSHYSLIEAPHRPDIAMDRQWAINGYRDIHHIVLADDAAGVKVKLFITDKPVFGKDAFGIHSATKVGIDAQTRMRVLYKQFEKLPDRTGSRFYGRPNYFGDPPISDGEAAELLPFPWEAAR